MAKVTQINGVIIIFQIIAAALLKTFALHLRHRHSGSSNFFLSFFQNISKYFGISQNRFDSGNVGLKRISFLSTMNTCTMLFGIDGQVLEISYLDNRLL